MVFVRKKSKYLTGANVIALPVAARTFQCQLSTVEHILGRIETTKGKESEEAGGQGKDGLGMLLGQEKIG